MTGVGLIVGATAIGVLYQTAIEQVRDRLEETAQSQARMMESVARFDKKFTTYPDGPRAATLSQIQEAFEQFKLKGLGKTGEFTLAHRQGDNIVFLEAHQHVLTGETKSVPFESELAQPMRRALSGESGTILGPDYHGHMVLAAFAPVAELDLGLVAKIDLEEIRAPFLRAGWIVLGVATIVIALGTLLFFIVGEPMIRRIRESEARYRELFDHSPTPILVVDPRTTMPILFNKPLLSILEYSQAEFASTPIEDYEVLDTKSEIDTNIEEFMIAGGAEFETLWRTRSGELRDVVVHARHLEMEGKPVLHCVITDLTERVRAERKVRELQEHLMQVSRINELGEMASALAHELKQPLTAALNYINACRRCIDGEDGAAASRAIELSKKAGAQIDRAAAIINSLQALVHRRPSQRTTQDINDVVREAAMLALADAAVRGIEYRLRLAPDLPPITIDRIQIQQVVFNLVRNAIEAMSTSAVRHLSIETAQTDPTTVETAVRDTGSGLPEEVADRLFQPFVTTKPRGMGMGLSISQTIITAHGGRIWAEPGREGGTTLFFDLPISS
jgi:two-component system sensor kinase FixL